ncbi:MAG: hypothetical protein HY456_01160, partial [Parcubacteria group bacterium]|nr:hypothetical protein [Parcubacteria group bacterium]
MAMKRRFVAFLILAVAATSTGLIFRLGAGDPQTASTTTQAPNKGPVFEALADAKSVPAATAVNLTQSLAQRIGQDLIDKNKHGPENIDGTQWLNVPNPQKIAQNYLEEEVKKFKVEDFKPTIRDEDVRITREKDIEVLRSYLQSFQKIQEALAQTNINRQNFSIDDARKIESAYENIIATLSSASVPEIFVPIHKTALELFITQKNFLNAATNYENDPIRAVLAIQNANFFQESIEKNRQELNREIENLSKQSLSEYAPFEQKGLAEKLLFINRAYADVPTIDLKEIAATISGFAKTILTTVMEWGKDLARWAAEKAWIISVEALKKRLLDMIVDQIVRWIQGGGEPKFITDWQGFLRDAFNVGFDEVIRQLGLGFLCSPFSAQVRLALSVPRPFSQQITCSLDRVVNNINAFYRNFQSGGWLAYQSVWQPENNIFGATLIGYDELIRRGTETRDAARNEGLANNGFLSIKRCAEYGDEDLEGNRICDRYETVTPGKTIGDAAARTVGADIDYIVNARDLSAYIAAIGDAFINRLVREGAGLISGGGYSSVGTGSAPAGGYIPTGVSGQCAGLSGAALSACIDAVQANQNLTNAGAGACTGLTGQTLNQCLSKGCSGLQGEQLSDCLVGVPTAAITS